MSFITIAWVQAPTLTIEQVGAPNGQLVTVPADGNDAVCKTAEKLPAPLQPRRSREEILGVGVAAPPTTMVVAG